MKIRHLSGPKANTTEHVNNVIGQTLVTMGAAEEIRLPERGSPDWLEQRLSLSRNAGPPSTGDTVVPYTENVEWQVRDRITPLGSVTIIRRFQYETVHFDQHQIQQNGFPSDCPQSIIKQFNNLTKASGLAAEALDEARRKNQAYEESIRNVKRW
jgi:hypothetical protein